MAGQTVGGSANVDGTYPSPLHRVAIASVWSSFLRPVSDPVACVVPVVFVPVADVRYGLYDLYPL